MKQDHFNANVMKQLKQNSDMIALLSDLLFRSTNDIRGVGKHASMVQTWFEQVSKSQGEFLSEMNNNMKDYVVRVATRGGKMTQEQLYPEGHPKRIEQDSQRINTNAPSTSKKNRKNKNDRTLHTPSEPEIEKPLEDNNMFLFLMLKLNQVMNIHLVIMKKITMMFTRTLNQTMINNQIMMLR